MFRKKDEVQNKNPTKTEKEWLEYMIESCKKSIKVTERLKMKAFKVGKMKGFYMICGSQKECAYMLKQFEERLNEIG